MKRSAILRICALLVVPMMMTGCCLRKSRQQPCCPPYVKQTPSTVISAKVPGAGVVADFSSVQPFEEVRRNLLSQVGFSESLVIDLPEATCLAATNSQLAELVEAERHAIKCQSDDCRGQLLDLILAGQALELRNQDAGRAGELFLRLVEIQLQRQLIAESNLELDELERTLDQAAEAGFATAEGRLELTARRTDLKQSASKLGTNDQRIQYELNQLFGRGQKGIALIQPVFELTPVFVELDTRRETAIAESNRPGVRAMQAALDCDPNNESMYSLLSQFDRRLGIRLLAGKSTLCSLLSKPPTDPALGLRAGQAQQAIDSLRQQARIETGEAMLKIQSSYEQVALLVEDIDRLSKRLDQLEASKDVIDGKLFLQMKQVWAERQTARAELISQAVENEIGRIKLLQAQGRLLDECGLGSTTDCCQGCSE